MTNYNNSMIDTTNQRNDRRSSMADFFERIDELCDGMVSAMNEFRSLNENESSNDEKTSVLTQTHPQTFENDHLTSIANKYNIEETFVAHDGVECNDDQYISTSISNNLIKNKKKVQKSEIGLNGSLESNQIERYNVTKRNFRRSSLDDDDLEKELLELDKVGDQLRKDMVAVESDVETFPRLCNNTEHNQIVYNCNINIEDGEENTMKRSKLRNDALTTKNTNNIEINWQRPKPFISTIRDFISTILGLLTDIICGRQGQ